MSFESGLRIKKAHQFVAFPRWHNSEFCWIVSWLGVSVVMVK
jgi:hypothetical protein